MFCEARYSQVYELAVLDASVDDIDAAIRAQGIVGLAFLKAALEAVVKARNLIPLTKITVQIQRRDRRVVNLWRRDAARHYNSGESSKSSDIK